MIITLSDKSKKNLDYVIVVYITVTCIVYELLLIVPFLTLLSKTPFYSIESYLGIIGAFLLAWDFLTTKQCIKGKYSYYLIGITILAVFSSLRTFDLGIKNNIFIISWSSIEFTLMYSLASRLHADILKRFIRNLLLSLSTIWVVACIYSIYQFVFQIQYFYVVDPRSDDLSLARQGFVNNRLFGIFNPLNHAAILSVMLFLGMLYLFSQSRGISRVFSIVCEIVFFTYIILSGSRSAQLSLIICISFVVGLYSKTKFRNHKLKNLFPVINSVFSIIICVLIIFLAKSFWSEVPRYVEKIFTNSIEENIPKDLDSSQEDSIKLENNYDILDRDENLQNNFSNNRFRIWKDYLKLYNDIGFIGLSPGNYQKYINKHHSDIYIVSYMRENFPEKYAGGAIYHTHNGYLEVYVSTGMIGLLLLSIFLLLCGAQNLSFISRADIISNLYIFAFAVSLAGLISAMFDRGLFFMNNTSAYLFWITAGILMEKTKNLDVSFRKRMNN